MTFCTDCGTPCAECATKAEQKTAMDREVEMERLRTQRDIKVAAIQAGVDRDRAETYADTDIAIATIEAETGVVTAEAVADVLEEIVTPEQQPPADPVLIPDAPAETEEADTIGPRETGSSAPPEDTKSGWSYW
jgi:hypothetical protein